MGNSGVNHSSDCKEHLQAVAGAGFDWKFSEEAVNGGFLMRVMSMVVSVGGMLITALLLGIVSGEHAIQ